MRWVLLGCCVLVGALLAARSDFRPRARGSQLAPSSAAPRFGGLPATEGEAGDGPVSGPRAKKAPRIVPMHPTWRETLAGFESWPHDISTARLRRILRDTLGATKDPVRRQYLIFLLVRLLSREDAKALLSELDDPADAEDVLVALAFNGDEDACAKFLELAGRPSRAAVAHLIDKLPRIEEVERMGNEDARDILRSYRAIEVLTRDFYFRVLNEELRVPYESRWRSRVDRKLLEAWLARYPGHPGSDDVAVWLGWRSSGLDRARWFARAASLPDQRRTSNALQYLVHVIEADLSLRDLETLIAEEGPQPVLLAYVRIRRIAADRGYREGLRAARGYARDHPATPIGYAWRDRWGVGAPRGTPAGHPPGRGGRVGPDWAPRSGEGWPVQLGRSHDTVAAQRAPVDRLSPPREAMTLDARLLAHQFRCWEALADLKGSRLDQARILLENPHALYPVYMVQSSWGDKHLGSARVHGYERARRLLEGLDGAEAAFLRARTHEAPMLYKNRARQLANYGRTTLRRWAARLADRFESVAESHPGASVVPEALVRADYWRAQRFDDED